MISNQTMDQILFFKREKLLKEYDIKLTYNGTSSFVYCQYDKLNIPFSYYYYKKYTDEEFITSIFNEFYKYNVYPKTKQKINMSNNDLKKQLHRKKILLEDNYIIPIYTLGNNSKFKLRKLQINGNIEIDYPYDDFCNKDEKPLLTDILDKFRSCKTFREIKPTSTTYKVPTYKTTTVTKRPNVDMLSKWDGGIYSKKVETFELKDIKEKKDKIRKNLIKKGFIWIQ